MTTKKKQISGKSKASKPAKPTNETMDDLPETHEKLTAKKIARRKVEKAESLKRLREQAGTHHPDAPDAAIYELWHKAVTLNAPEKHEAWLRGGKVIPPEHIISKVVAGTEEVAGQQIPCVTTHYKDGSTSKRYGNDAFQLIRGRNGKWSHQYDYGKVSIDKTISQGTGYMSHEDYAQLRYAMSLIEGARKGHMESKAALNEFVMDGVINSTNAPKVIQKATRMLDQVMDRELDNEWIMLSIAVLAKKLDRPPTKVEARKFHVSYGGVTYPTSAAFGQQLEVIGATWLPAGVRGPARHKQ
jgi:hypothetical protein